MTISDTTAGGGTASPDLCWALAPRIRPVPGGLIRGDTGVREPAARSMGRKEGIAAEGGGAAGAHVSAQVHDLVTADVRRAAQLLDTGLRSFTALTPPQTLGDS